MGLRLLGAPGGGRDRMVRRTAHGARRNARGAEPSGATAAARTWRWLIAKCAMRWPRSVA